MVETQDDIERIKKLVTPEEVVEKIESLLPEKGLRKRGALCGRAANSARWIILKEDAETYRNPEDYEAKVFNTWALHGVARGYTHQDILGLENIMMEGSYDEMPEILQESFIHAICIGRIGDKFYLFDPTFCQFMRPETGRVFPANKDTGIKNSDSFVMKLYENGFIELNDQTLRMYLERTTTEGARGKLPAGVCLENIWVNTPQVPVQYEKEELDEMVFRGSFHGRSLT